MSEIICPISGIKLIRAPYMLGFKLQELHPIFRMRRKDLITEEIVFKFNKSQNIEEKRLYFLAVLNSTDLVTFNCIAEPSLRTIENSFITAMQIAGWLDYASWQVSKEIPFPHYVVNPDSRDMWNVKVWLQSIDDIRHTTLNKKEELRRKNEVVDKIFKDLADAFKKDRFFTPWLADWCLEYTELNKHPKAALFKEILLTKHDNAWGIDRDVLSDLHDLLEAEFDKNHPAYAPVFGQINALLAAQKKGFTDFEILDTSISFVEETTGLSFTKRVPIAEAYKEFAGTDEPKREQFVTQWAWLQAKAKWKLSQLDSARQNKGDGNGTEQV